MKSKIIAGSVIAAILITGILTGYIVHRIQRQNTISEAKALFDQGKYQETIDRLMPSLEGDARSPDERVLIAESMYRIRQFDRAQEIIDPLLKAGQEDAHALLLSGWLWIKANSPLQAQVRFEKAANLGQEAEAEGGMGAVSLLRSENYRSSFLNIADSQLKKSIALDQTNAKVYLALSELRLLQHQYKEAIELVNKAIELAPYWAEPYGMQGRIYLLEDNHAEAEKSFTESQKYGGSREETQYYLALSVYYQGRIGEALSHLDELIQTGKEKVADALVDAAKILLLTDRKKALEYLERAWTMKPDQLTGIQLFEILSAQKPETQEQQEKAASILKDILSNGRNLSLANLETGNLLMKSNEIGQAYSSYQNVLEQDGSNFWANFNLGYFVSSRGDFNLAPGYFESVVRENEDYFPAQVNLILSQLAIDQVSETENSIQDLLSRYPDNPYILLAGALQRFASGDSSGSLELLDKSLQTDLKQAIPLVIRGEIMLRLFQFDKSQASFQDALHVDENNLRARLGKAHASYRIGEFSTAEQEYQELFNHLSSLSQEQQMELKNGQAMIAVERGESQKAVEIWDQLKKIDPEMARQFSVVNEGLIDEDIPSPVVIEDLKIMSMSRSALPETFYNLAVFYNTLDRIDESIEAYETLIKRYPNYLPGLYNLANLYQSHGRRGDAIALFDRAHNTAPQRVDILNNQAAVYAHTEQFDRARERLNDAEAIDANFSEIRYNKILLALREGKLTEAKKLLETIKSTSISSVFNSMADGLVNAAEGKWKNAEKSFSDAIRLEPQNAYAHMNQGIALSKLKRYEEAQSALQEAIRCDSSNAETHRVLGLLYCELGLFPLAKIELQSALQLDTSQSDLNEIITQINKWMNDINTSNP